MLSGAARFVRSIAIALQHQGMVTDHHAAFGLAGGMRLQVDTRPPDRRR